jgi:hypothetical protein
MRRSSPLLHPEGSFQIDFPDYGCLDLRVGPQDVVFLSLFAQDKIFHVHPLARHTSHL